MKRRFARLFAACCVLTIVVHPNVLVAAEPTPPSANGETRFLDELYRIELLPRLQTGETCKMFSSYDRTGGNNDGFWGTYSKLREENGNSVIAEMNGPGCIQRMFFTHSEIGKPGLLNLKREHIRIYLDGEKKPALDVPLEDIFNGKLEGFPKPLADVAIGGFYCYVPIPYKKSCKVVVDGLGVRFYHVGYRTFPTDNGIVTFRYPPTEPQRKALAMAVKVWKSCGGNLVLLCNEEMEIMSSVERKFSLKAGESFDWKLPGGPHMVGALYLKVKPEQIQNANSARLQITWDGAKTPAVDLPLDYFYCQAKQPGPFRSLLIGATDKGWYNFMPMPYRKSGKITIKAAKPLEGTLTLVTTAIDEKPGDLGYLHAVYNESLPTKTGIYHPYLKRQGRGKVIGAYLVTDGQHESKLPVWLEGDEQFTCDGELRIHGTGTEDGFNGGWYAVPGRLDGPGATPLTGFPIYRKEGERHVDVAYRWYLTDPVSYEKSIDFELEHGGTNDINANYRTAAFFYDAAP